jgi:hypothetical protein
MHVKLRMTIAQSMLVLEWEGDDSTVKVNNMKVNGKALHRGKQGYLQWCQSSELKNRDEYILSGVLFLGMSWQRISISSMLNTLLVVPMQKGKGLLPTTIQTQAMASRILGCPPNNQPSGEFVLLSFSFVFILTGLGIPSTSLSRARRVNKLSSWE